MISWTNENFKLNTATQPSFLQQAVNLDVAEKHLIVLGEVNKQFVASPNVEALLGAMEDERSEEHRLNSSHDELSRMPSSA